MTIYNFINLVLFVKKTNEKQTTWLGSVYPFKLFKDKIDNQYDFTLLIQWQIMDFFLAGGGCQSSNRQNWCRKLQENEMIWAQGASSKSPLIVMQETASNILLVHRYFHHFTNFRNSTNFKTEKKTRMYSKAWWAILRMRFETCAWNHRAGCCLKSCHAPSISVKALTPGMVHYPCSKCSNKPITPVLSLTGFSMWQTHAWLTGCSSSCLNIVVVKIKHYRFITLNSWL